MMQTPTYPAAAKSQAPNLPQQPQYEITDADKRRQKAIEAAWKAYCGELDAPLQRMPGQPDDNVLTNRMQAIVDRGVDFLFGKELEISVEEDGPEEVQDFLNTTWGRKEARIPLLQKLAMNGAIAGQAFLRIVACADGSFRLVVVDPATVFVKTMPQDCETVLLYCIQYECDEKDSLGKPRRIQYREEISRIDPTPDAGSDGYEDVNADDIDANVTWSIQHWSRIGDRGNWTPAGEPITWDYPFPPLFSCQNLPKPNDFWGFPDITPDLIGVNNSLNLVQSNINRVLKIYGQPIIWGKGIGESIIDIKPGKIAMLPPDGQLAAVAIQSDIANALSFASNLRSDIDEQSSTPGVATGRISELPRGQMSGIAIELLFMPLVKKNDKKRCSYGELIIDVSKALLVLKRMSGDIEITLPWQSPLLADDLQSVQAALLKKQVGISNQTLQRELGYDPVEEAELSQQEDQVALTNYAQGVGMPPAAPLQGSDQPDQPGQQPAESPFIGGGQ